jgi:long-chain acyl-CoA synthetase
MPHHAVAAALTPRLPPACPAPTPPLPRPAIGRLDGEQMPTLKNIIYTDDKVKPEDRLKKPVCQGVSLYSFEEVIELGERNPVDFTPPTAKSMAVVMYTSGSTGKPKGVLIRHGAMLAEVAGVVQHFEPVIVPGQEVFAAFLPLAHILALAAEQSQLAVGAAIGYCDPRTLTNSGAEPKGALAEFRPTIMAAVPKIWDIIKKGAEAKAKAGGNVKHFIFQTAVSTKIAMKKMGMDTPLFNALVFKKIGEITGGRLKVAISGGGPLDKQVQEFCSVAICPVIQGYGLTETLGGNCIQPIGDTRTGVVGIPLSSVEVRLIDAVTEDGSGHVCDTHGRPYLANDTTNANGEPCKGRGEILIGGNTLSDGYFKMPKETKESYITTDGSNPWDAQRWFATGDIGEWTPDGCIKIVDRKKNLVKLLGGEYVPIENMESKFGNSLYVDALAGGIMVYADGTMDRAVAFAQANKKELIAWAEANGVPTKYPELLQNMKARAMVWNDLLKAGKAGGLGELETLFNVTLLDGAMGDGPDAWTPANGGLTATNKLQRKTAIKLIQAAYGDKVWAAALKDNRKDLKAALA